MGPSSCSQSRDAGMMPELWDDWHFTEGLLLLVAEVNGLHLFGTFLASVTPLPPWQWLPACIRAHSWWRSTGSEMGFSILLKDTLTHKMQHTGIKLATFWSAAPWLTPAHFHRDKYHHFLHTHIFWFFLPAMYIFIFLLIQSVWQWFYNTKPQYINHPSAPKALVFYCVAFKIHFNLSCLRFVNVSVHELEHASFGSHREGTTPYQM